LEPSSGTYSIHDFAFRQPEIVQPALKYSNLALSAQSITTGAVLNPAEKTATDEAEPPANAALEMLSRSYLAGLAG
jgi:hypothetical protein